MKKKYLPLIFGFVVFAGVAYRLGAWKQLTQTAQPDQTVIESELVDQENLSELKQESEILEIVYSESEIVRVEKEKMEGKSALEFLLEVVEEKDIEIEKKEYDFGVMVHSIGGRQNSSENAWIYFVNEQSADVGASEYILSDGDRVDWKYIKPIY